MDQEKPVFAGNLLFTPQGMVFNKITKKKSMQQKYCLLFKASNHGIERLEIFDTKDDTQGASQRIITLENCVKITQNPPVNFTVVTKTGVHQLQVVTESMLEPWVAAFQSVAFKDEANQPITFEEDNDLYCSSGKGVFTVKLRPSDASNRCGLEPTVYTLCVTSTAIQLRENNDSKLLATWPYMYIRRYGYSDGKFSFEAGRKCDTGEGSFYFEHSKQQEIFRCLSSKMKSMKKLINGESMAGLDCGDNQFQAALSMEARSRSPLPPSPTGIINVLEMESSSTIQSSQRPSFNSIDSQKSAVLNSKSHTVKPQPVKPPRKNIFTIAKDKFENVDQTEIFGKYSKDSNYEPIASYDNYDHVEYRQDAWRTFGVDDVKHTENVDTLKDEINFIHSRSKSQDNLNTDTPIPSSKILLTQVSNNSDSNYDTLQFFGSTTKLHNRSYGYKQINHISTNNSAPPKVPISNDYDEVENILPCRLADDSHQGYGMIRKAATAGPQVPTPCPRSVFYNDPNSGDISDVDHEDFNGSQYAVVSKPKRV